MPLCYTVEDGIVFVDVTGAPGFEEVKAFIERWRADPDLPSPVLVCRDNRGAEASDLETVRALADLAASLDLPAGSKLAIVAASDLDFGMSRMYELLAGDAGFAISVFRQMSEALRWLRA